MKDESVALKIERLMLEEHAFHPSALILTFCGIPFALITEAAICAYE
ncbi:MAG TPA: hypothetical protein VGC91_13495 [Pyrinomonadaceae bacterium]|jgi:hypothetical protein